MKRRTLSVRLRLSEGYSYERDATGKTVFGTRWNNPVSAALGERDHPNEPKTGSGTGLQKARGESPGGEAHPRRTQPRADFMPSADYSEPRGSGLGRALVIAGVVGGIVGGIAQSVRFQTATTFRLKDPT